MEQTILETAERLFLAKGYALTSTTEIAREAGCNQALVHYYFRTKEQLFLKIFIEKIRINAPLGFSQTKGTFREKVAAAIEAHFDILAHNIGIPFLVINEITTNPERIHAIRKSLGDLPNELTRPIAEELRAEIEAGRVRQTTIFDLILSIISLNLSVFILQPILQNLVPLSDEEFGKMLEHRKKEHVRIILKSLEP